MSVFAEKYSLGSGPVSLAVKDTIDVAGLPTRAGSATLADAPPAQHHADVVRALLDSGEFHLVGKTCLHELAFGITGVNALTGTPVNPRYPDRIPGGSSSGSAVAVAAGEVRVALGTDTGGSVRMPAACCGIYGLKPTFGRVSRKGVMPARTSIDCVGPMTLDPALLTRAMSAMTTGFAAGYTDAGSTVKVGWVPVAATDEILRTVRAALEDWANVELTERVLVGMEDAFAAGLTVINRETWLACRHLLDRDGMGEDVRKRLTAAGETTDEQLAGAEAVRRQFIDAVDAALSNLDVLAMPTLPDVPMRRADALAGKTDLRATSLVRPFNLSGHPAVTIPLETADGLPAGLQLIGRRGEDETLCRLAEQFHSQRH